jgi:hypothetical protein
MTQEGMLLLSSLSLGIFLGAQITEAFLLVPYWKSINVDDFFDFYKTYGREIHQFFSPLTILATVIPLITVVYSFIHQSHYQPLFGLMGVCVLAFFLSYFLYFKNANQRFFDRCLPDEKLPNELKKWGNWHSIRVFFEFIAFVLSLFLLMKT